jgi:hypothetical protein
MRRPFRALILLLVVACSTNMVADDGYELSEWAVDGPGRMHAGQDTIAVENAGEYGHTLIVTNEEGQVVGATGLVDPGATATLAINLDAGTYVFSCRIVAEDDEGALSDHYEQGMNRTVDVTA